MTKEFNKTSLSNISAWLIFLVVGLGGFIFANVSDSLFIKDMAKIFDLHISHDPPFYFIVQDYYHGLILLQYWLVCLLAAVGIWRLNKLVSLWLVMFASIWSWQYVWSYCVILMKTRDIFDPLKRHSDWQTFDQYMKDPLVMVGWGAGFIVLVGLAFVIRKHQKQKAKENR